MTQPAPIPANEPARLARLQALAVLDSAPEPLFDTLTQAAAELCATPIARLVLVDADRAWSKSQVGLPDAAVTPRALSFCGHALTGPEVLEVRDASLDPRFAANPWVTGAAKLRFYAGAPVTLSDGLTVGTLCIIDHHPRELDATQRAALIWLSHAAAHALEARARALSETQSAAVSRQRLDNLYRSAPAMLQSADAQGALLEVSDVWLAQLGYRRREVIGRQVPEFLTAESATYTRQVVRPALFRHGRCERVELQMVRKNGSVLDVLLSAIVERDATGAALGSMAIIENVTDRKRAERELRDSEARYRALIQGQSEMVSTSTPDGLLSFVNEAYVRFYGQPAEALVGTRVLDQVPEEERAAVTERLERVFDLGLLSGGEDSLFDSQGQQHWIEWTNRPVTDDEGRVIGMHAVGRDITQRRQVEQRLAESRELLQVTLDSIGDGVITTDAEGLVQWLNPVAERLTGWMKGEAQGLPLAQVFNAVDDDNHDKARDSVAQCLAEGRAVARADDKVLISREGREYGITDSASPIRDPQGALLGAVLVFHDATEQRRMSREINHRARHDALTGLANRTEFELRLTQLLARARNDGSTNALLFIDLDQFKLVNDACGHSAGDLLLRQVSSLLQAGVRSRDTVARLGGDEFGVLLENCPPEVADRLAQSICDRMEEFRFVHENRRFRVGTSIGLVLLDGRFEITAAAAMQAADTSCYAAKEAGRNRVHTWLDTDLAMRARHGEMQWVNRIEQALDDDRFELFAQRIVPTTDAAAGGAGRLHCELLLRLREPDGTLVAPGAFFPAAERFHMAARIDRWVLRRAFAWLTAVGAGAERIELIAINLSGQSIGDGAFRRDLVEMLRRAAFDRGKLCVELTETVAITNLTEARGFIEDMRALGVKIALDDFGAGASSFGYLKTLPVDFLKIDGQFITDLLDDRLDNAAVRCFCEVAQVVGVKTIAEFVERADVLEALREIGVDYAQGYLVHRPLPLDEVFGKALVPPSSAA